MRKIEKLPGDLRRWVSRTVDRAKPQIGFDALTEARELAPEETGFTKAHGYLYIDDQRAKQTNYPVTDTTNKVAPDPQIAPNHDITIAFHAGRPSRKHATFIYTYYIGVIDPAHIKDIHAMHWIETSLNPDLPLVQNALARSFKWAWQYLQS